VSTTSSLDFSTLKNNPATQATN
jgi:hypothetical protein